MCAGDRSLIQRSTLLGYKGQFINCPYSFYEIAPLVRPHTPLLQSMIILGQLVQLDRYAEVARSPLWDF